MRHILKPGCKVIIDSTIGDYYNGEHAAVIKSHTGFISGEHGYIVGYKSVEYNLGFFYTEQELKVIP